MTVTVRPEGTSRVVTIDRPHRRNSLAPETLVALREAAVALRRDPTVRGVVLTGAPGVGVFLSGGDLEALAGVKTARAARNLARAAYAAIDALRSVGVPLVAAVHGDAYGGGCELAAACDHRVAESQVRFHWVQTRFAVTTGFGGTSHLLDLVPRGVAARWLLTTEPVSCAEAHAAGFVDAVTPPGESLAEALRMLDAVAVQPREAVRRMLTLVRESGRLTPRQARTLELNHFGRAWASHEHHEAVARFLQRPR